VASAVAPPIADLPQARCPAINERARPALNPIVRQAKLEFIAQQGTQVVCQTDGAPFCTRFRAKTSATVCQRVIDVSAPSAPAASKRTPCVLLGASVPPLASKAGVVGNAALHDKAPSTVVRTSCVPVMHDPKQGPIVGQVLFELHAPTTMASTTTAPPVRPMTEP
jgi:hypothetical protein